MKLTKDQLRFHLLVAFSDAKKGKSNKSYVKDFANKLDENIDTLVNELLEYRYHPQEFSTFCIKDPKPREIFVSNFRDRIVHHLYYNYLHELFESTFLTDSYSCIKHKGTSYGIARLDHHIRSASKNYTEACYVMKMDIKSYFINIRRDILLSIVLRNIDSFEKKYKDKLDWEFLRYLSRVIILTDPTINVKFVGLEKYKSLVPKSKSLLHAKLNCGLPLGNLTSQLYSNVYLNLLDQFVKRVLKCKHYGRYVDDFYLLSGSKEELHYFREEIKIFLKEVLKLDINEGKTIIRNIKHGIEFLGAYIKPNRIYVSNKTLSRMKINLKDSKLKLLSSIISRIGLLSQFNSYNIRYKLV